MMNNFYWFKIFIFSILIILTLNQLVIYNQHYEDRLIDVANVAELSETQYQIVYQLGYVAEKVFKEKIIPEGLRNDKLWCI